MKAALTKCVKGVDDISIDRFIRFLDKDKRGRVHYVEFLDKMFEISNRNHNPFKNVVVRLNLFLQ